MSALGHSLPMYSAPVPANVRCYSNSGHSGMCLECPLCARNDRSPADSRRSLCHAIKKTSSNNYRFNKKVARIDVDHILPPLACVRDQKNSKICVRSPPIIGEQSIMQHQGAIKTLNRGTPTWFVRATGLAAAILIAGAALTFTSAPVDASPNKVTKDKPCGSCHPPNKPPGK